MSWLWVHCLSCCEFVFANCPVVLHWTLNFHMQCTNAHIFNKICFHKTYPTPGIICSTVRLTKKFALCWIPVQSNMATVSRYLALPKAMYSHSVYLHWMSIREEMSTGRCNWGGNAEGNTEKVEIWEIVINQSFCNYMSKNFKPNNRR